MSTIIKPALYLGSVLTFVKKDSSAYVRSRINSAYDLTLVLRGGCYSLDMYMPAREKILQIFDTIEELKEYVTMMSILEPNVGYLKILRLFDVAENVNV